MHLQPFDAAALLARGGGNGIEVHNEALAVEVGNVVAGDFEGIVGIVFGLQIERESGATLYAGGLAQIVDLDEIVGISGFLGGSLKVELANDVNFHDFSPLPFSVLYFTQEPADKIPMKSLRIFLMSLG
jgi:hypothetical protein